MVRAINQLPVIEYNGQNYYFDERLSELRAWFTLETIKVRQSKIELLAFWLSEGNKEMIKETMAEIMEEKSDYLPKIGE